MLLLSVCVCVCVCVCLGVLGVHCGEMAYILVQSLSLQVVPGILMAQVGNGDL